MDPSRFDRLTRVVFGSARSRRSMLGASIASVASIGLRDTSAQEATPALATPVAPDSGQEFLFVQTASGGSFQPNPNAGTPVVAAGTPTAAQSAEYLLTLTGHAGGTVYFSDRPDRIVGTAGTQQFFDGMDFSPLNPPNAALAAGTGDGQQEIIVLELSRPSYDAGADSITYEASILEEYDGDGLTHLADQRTGTTPPESFGESALFIDDCPDTDLYCYTADGLLLCATEGIVRHVGTCWYWPTLSCDVCNSSPGDICDEHFASCNGQCVGKTLSEVEHEGC